MDAVSALNFILARVGKWVNYHIVFIPFHGKEKIEKRAEEDEIEAKGTYRYIKE